MKECAKCGAPMQPLQDWCLQCGAGQPGSLRGGSSWRIGAAILAATVLLVAGASVAAYAALNRHARKPSTTVAARTTVGAIAPTTTPTIPATTTAPTTTAPTTPGATTPPPGLPTTIKATPPKIPLQTPTPKSSGESTANKLLFPAEAGKQTKTTGASGTPGKSGTTSSEGSESGSNSGAEPPSPILLDTNAASTYDPYAYPSSWFGEPSFAIDGDEKTAWTASVDPAKAPHMAEGLVLDLKTAQRLGSAIVKTTTPGMTAEVYGANGHNLPASITEPAWKPLSGLKALKKKSTTLKLKTSGRSYRFVLLWIAKAPPGSTAANPGYVAVSELELFPPS